MKHRILVISTMALALFVFGCGGKKAAVEPPAEKQLIQGQWDPFNRGQLNKLLAEYGNTSKNYNPAKKPYVVFDWDNTSVFLDIEEAQLIYQLENLLFKMNPVQMNKAIRMGVDKKNFNKDYNNAAGKAVDIDMVAPDIVAAYDWLYKNYKGLKGKKSLEEVKKAPQYQEFITKMRYLYEAVGDDPFSHDVAYNWVLYLFTGMTEKEVRAMTVATVDWQVKQPIESVKWTSPASVRSKAGVVSVSWKNGLRLVPEMQDLYKKFRDNGFDVWVCSASFVDVIKEISSNPKFGYNNDPQKVVAMELERDAKGVILTEYRKGYVQTQRKGKTTELKRQVAPKYDGRGPIFVAGDSEGDENMMVDFPNDTKLVLIVNRLRSPKNTIGKLSKEAVDTYGKPDAKVILQGRDDNKGVFVPSQLHYKLGSKEGLALRK